MKKKLVLFCALVIATTVVAETYFIRTNSDVNSWNNIPSSLGTKVTLEFGDDFTNYAYVGNNTVYLAPGTYYLPSGISVEIEAGKLFGGFKGDESAISLSTRPLVDKDLNGLIEPWEFQHEAIITTSFNTAKFVGAGVVTRMVHISGNGGEMNGVTLTDYRYNGSGPIMLGIASDNPTAADNISDKAGILRLCTVKKIMGSHGIIMSTNKNSLIDRCLIESNVIIQQGGGVYLHGNGGKVTSSLIRNNSIPATGGRGAGVYATSLSGLDMDAIVENCVVHNNYAGTNGGGIRGEAQAGKRGIQIINSTIVNNQTGAAAAPPAASVELITSGTIVNSIVIGDHSVDLRCHTENNYVMNTAYGTFTGSAANGTGNVAGKSVADFKFVNPTTFIGVMIPDYTPSFDVNKYNQIRAANFSLTDTFSAAVATPGLKVLPTTYQYGATPTTVSLTAAIPAFDLRGTDRFLSNGAVKTNLGAYQLSSQETSVFTIDNNQIEVLANSKQISISGAEGKFASLYSISGQLLHQHRIDADWYSIPVNNKGIYVLKINGFSTKIIVKD